MTFFLEQKPKKPREPLYKKQYEQEVLCKLGSQQEEIDEASANDDHLLYKKKRGIHSYVRYYAS